LIGGYFEGVRRIGKVLLDVGRKPVEIDLAVALVLSFLIEAL
jgi:hypothetical protein